MFEIRYVEENAKIFQEAEFVKFDILRVEFFTCIDKTIEIAN